MNWNFAITNGPKRTQLNNGITSIQGGMPLKELTSSNENQFSMNRHKYAETHKTLLSKNTDILLKKKYIPNANRDSSSRILSIKSKTIGNSLNPDKKAMSFTASNENTLKQAIQRVRNKGYVVPNKVVNNTNSPIFY